MSERERTTGFRARRLIATRLATLQAAVEGYEVFAELGLPLSRLVVRCCRWLTGGGFVHRFMLWMPTAKVDRAVAANPAFFTMPSEEAHFPFGTGETQLTAEDLDAWFSRRMVLLLGDQDTGPRTKPLSNGPLARRQGPSVLARGLGFYKAVVERAASRQIPLNWKLEVVRDVGHSNTQMAPYAVKYLVP